MATIPAYSINGFTRPELILDGFGNIVLDDTASAFVQTYGLRALYIGCPPSTPYPPVLPSLLFPTDTNGAPDTVAEGAAANTTVGITAHATSILGFPVTYSLTADSSGGGFQINPTTGVVSVAVPSRIDFESSPGHSYSITVRANDGILTTSRSFTIGVSDVAPSTPADANAAANTVAEGAANGTAVGVTVSATDVNGGTVTYSLTDDANGAFTINSTTGVITVADSTRIDFETAAGHAYTVTARASDGTLFSSTQTFTINVTDVAPSTPTDSNNAANTVAEGAANGSTVGLTASSVDPNGPATTYSLTDSAGGRFAIDSTTGVVTVANGAAIDFETAAGHAYGITVQATSGATSTTQAFTIGVSDVGPSAPTDTNGAVNTVFEGAANGTAVGITASSTDPGGGPAPIFSLTDSAGGRFAIDPTTGIVTVANGAAIDFETAAGHAYGITVQAQAGALTTTQNFSIGVANVNEAPAGTNNAVLIAEDTSYVFSAADFGFTDPSDSSAPNALQAVRITTVPGAGGTLTNNGNPVNAGDFISATDIAAGHLVFTPPLNANGSPEATFTFQVQDNGGTANGGVDTDQSPNTFTINVNAGNDAPINSVPGTQSVNEDATLTFSAGTGNAITISDVDVGSGDETVTLTAANGTLALGSTANLTSFTNNAGSITLTGTVAHVNAALDGLTYHGNLNFNGTDSLVVSTNDNGNTGAGGPQNDTDSVTINVAAVNDAPVNHVPGAQTVNEDTNLVFTGANAITISDVDGGSGDETVTLAVASGTLALGSTANLTSFTNNAASITLTGTVAHINAALDGLTYHGNLNFNGADTLNITTSDNGNTGSGGAQVDFDFFTINVTAVNDAPVVTAGHTLNYTENQAATAIDPAVTVSDVDSANLASATVQISANYVNGEDLLGFTNQNGITGSYNAATGTLTLTGSSSVANYQTALASVTYVNTSDNPSAAARTVTIITNDGAANSVATTDTINVTPVNDAPVVTAGHTLNYTENQAATAIDPAITLSDVDSANLASATVQITGNYANGQDILAFANTATITGSFNAATGTLTLTGSDTVANYQAALASVTYVNTSDNPLSAARTVTIITNDGAASSVAATDTINVTPVNDAPVATAGHTLAYTENQAATAIDTAITVSDVDSANLASATVQISGNYVNGQDVLAFANTATITGSFNAVTGTLTLTGSDSVANYQAALDSVTYFNTSDDPSVATRTVTIITNDGAANSVATTDTITVTSVNDAPTLAATGNNPAYTATPVDLFSAVSASTIESGQLIDQLVLTVTNISGTATDSLTIDGTTVTLTNGNSLSTTTPGVSASVAVTGNTATVTIASTPGLSGTDMAALVNGLIYTDTNVTPGDPARVVTITSMHDTGGTTPGVDTTALNITSTVNFDIAPTVTAGHTLNYTENQAATAFDPAITVSDPDNANLASATVQISANYVNGEDVLGFTNQNGITGSFNATTGTLTLTGSSTVAHYQTALASVTYVNTSDNPSGAARTVTITTNDGILNSTPVTDTINVTPVNDAPVTVAGHTLSYTENQAATAIDPAITVSDVDNANLASATVQITANYVNGQDVLGFTTQNGITGSFNAATGTLSLAGSSSVANYQAALASVTYVNTSENPSGLARTVTIITNDGAANSVAVTDTINVTPVNDAPVSTAGGTLNYTENQVATAIDNSVTLSDVDSTNLSSATVQITGNYANGQDILGFTNQNGITGSFVAATGTLTLSGSSSVAHYQTALDSVTYFNNSDNPSGLDRTVTYTANDGALNSNSSTSTIHVTPVNDAPVVNATGTLNFTENQAATAIAPALTLTDADTTTLTSATVQISANYVSGEDVLAFSDQNGITGSFNAATGTLTLTGSSSVANYQTALASVTYVNTSDAPSTSARTVTFTADDGQAANHLSAGSNHIINVAAVDDAPTASVPTDASIGTAFSHTNLAISGLSVNDIDSGAGNVTATISSGNAGLTFTTAGLASSTNNGTHTVTLTGTVAQVNAALSTLTYNSDDGFTGSDTVTLSVNDNGNTGSGGPLGSGNQTFHVGVIPQVFVIDNTPAGAGNDGSLANPFNSLASFNANAADGSGDYVYVNTGTYSEADGINLVAGEHLFGQGQTLAFTNPVTGQVVTIGTGSAGATPIISVNGASQHGIDLASNNEVTGINVTTTLGNQIGIYDSGASVGNLLMNHIDVTGTGQAVNISHGGALNVAIDTLTSTGSSANGIQLGATGTALTGTFSAGTGANAAGSSISGSTGSAFLVGDGAGGAGTGGAATITFGGAITASNAASVVNIQDHSTGAVTLSGNLTHSGSGAGIILDGNSSNITFSGATDNLSTGASNAISINNQTGGTVAFTGTLNIDTTSGTGVNLGGTSTGTFNFTGSNLTIDTTGGNGFSATGGGTVNVTGTGNHINSASGTALNISNTTIGASNVTFHDINANGGTNGIVLNNTGTSGHLVVTGTGTTAGSGGTIQNTAGDGVSLTNTQDVTLSNMNITNNLGDGIGGSSVNGMVLNRLTISGNGNDAATDESGINIANLTGTASSGAHATSISNSTISNNNEFEIQISNSSGTLTNFQLINNTISANGLAINGNASSPHGSLVNFLGLGTSTMGLTVTGGSFTGNTVSDATHIITGTGIFANSGGTSMTANVFGATFTNNNAGVDVSTDPVATSLNFDIENNTFTGTRSTAINQFDNGNAPFNRTVNGTIQNNIIGNDAVTNSGSAVGSGITIQNEGAINGRYLINGNTISQIGGAGSGITVNVGLGGQATGGGETDLTITNNTIQDVHGSRAIIIQDNQDPSFGPFPTIWANIHDNTFANIAGQAGNGQFMRIRELSGTVRVTQDAPTAANTATELDNANNSTDPTKFSISGTVLFNQGAAPLPTTNPLPMFAAPGGVQASSPTPGETHLTQAQLDSVVAAAITQWAHAGASAAQLAALAAISFSVADLAGGIAGEQTPGHIVIDADAAGHGWFIDPTPNDNSEFTHAANAAGTDLFTDPANAAAGHLDLLTTVAHEMGHELGLPDLTAASDAHDLMYIDLVDGERRLPDTADVPVTNTTPLTPNVALGPVVTSDMELSSAYAPVVTGTPGNDTIDAGHGGKILVGGAGADNFVFANVQVSVATPPPLTHVADYSFAQGDSFDFSALTSAFHGSGFGDAQIVRAVEDASGTFATLQVNANGPWSKLPSWVNVAQLDGAHAGDDVSVLIDSHAVHLAQVHVGLLV